MGHTYTTNLLFVWNSSLIGPPICLFAKSGNFWPGGECGRLGGSVVSGAPSLVLTQETSRRDEHVQRLTGPKGSWKYDSGHLWGCRWWPRTRGPPDRIVSSACLPRYDIALRFLHLPCLLVEFPPTFPSPGPPSYSLLTRAGSLIYFPHSRNLSVIHRIYDAMGIGDWDPSWKGVCTPPETTDSIASKMIKLRSEQLSDSNQESWLLLLKASCVMFSHVCLIPVNQQNIKATVFTWCITVMRHLPLLKLPHQPHDYLRTKLSENAKAGIFMAGQGPLAFWRSRLCSCLPQWP